MIARATGRATTHAAGRDPTPVSSASLPLRYVARRWHPVPAARCPEEIGEDGTGDDVTPTSTVPVLTPVQHALG